MTEKLNAKKQSLEQTGVEQAKEVCLHSALSSFCYAAEVSCTVHYHHSVMLQKCRAQCIIIILLCCRSVVHCQFYGSATPTIFHITMFTDYLKSKVFTLINIGTRAVAAARGASAPGGTVQGQHLEEQKCGILKFGRFWRIGVCTAARIHPQLSVLFTVHTNAIVVML